MRFKILLFICLINVFKMGTAQQKIEFDKLGINLIHIGDYIGNKKEILPISFFPEKNKLIIGIKPVSFFYLTFQQLELHNREVKNIFVAVDSGNIVQSISIFINDTVNNFHEILDNIYGEGKLKSISTIGYKSANETFLWVTESGISIYLTIRKSVKHGQRFKLEIQIFANKNGIDSTDMSIYYRD